MVGIIILFIFKPSTSLADLIKIMQDGYVSKTGIKDIDSLLSQVWPAKYDDVNCSYFPSSLYGRIITRNGYYSAADEYYL